MLRRINSVVVIAVLFTTMIGSAGCTERTPKAQDKLGLGEDEVKQLPLLMDADKNGRISKEEYMKFMEAEFARLDKDNSGELDVKELTQSSPRVNRPAHSSR